MPYRGDHTYHFVIDVGSESRFLTLGYGDGGVSDNSGQFDIQLFSVQPLPANQAPACDLAHAVPSVLWPPNGRLVVVNIEDIVDPDNDLVTISGMRVTQDEPVTGDKGADAVITGSVLLVRAERLGTGNGRIYEVHFMAEDNRGGQCTASVKVGVPHSMKPGVQIIDDGQFYDSALASHRTHVPR
jgi:hypothetical protein